MKIRTDFVSNSSSCSFMVNDVKSFMSAFDKLSTGSNRVDTWWIYGLNVEFKFKNTEANRRAFKSFLDYYNQNEFHEKEIYVSGDFEKLFSIDKSNYRKMNDVRIYAYNDDGRDNTARLTLLYLAMKSENIDVDSSISERDLEIFPDVPDRIVNAAMKMYSQMKN